MMKKLWKYNRPDRACVHLPLILLSILSFADPFASPSYRNAQKGKFTAVYKTPYIRAWEEELESVNKSTIEKANAIRDDKTVKKENNDACMQLKAEEAEEEKKMTIMRNMHNHEVCYDYCC